MSKHKKSKKAKKQEQEEVFVLGDKIRAIKINQRQHFMFYIAMMVLFNAILIASVAFVLVYLNMWYNWVLCFIIVGICAYLTFNTYVHQKNFHKCDIHENALVINSIWFNIVVDVSKIMEITPKKSILDNMFKLNTYSMEVKMINSKRKKFTIHFIEEDVNQLKTELEQYIEKYKEQHSVIELTQSSKDKIESE